MSREQQNTPTNTPTYTNLHQPCKSVQSGDCKNCNNHIEEMAKEVCGNHYKGDCVGGECVCDYQCVYATIANRLYNAGDRKQSEGKWIDRHNGDFVNPIYMCSVCGKGTLLKPHINELDNMEMIQALSPFCPNCGAKMKGGAE